MSVFRNVFYHKPIFLFAFANDAQSSLRLAEESRAAREALEAAHHDQEQIEFLSLGYATFDDLYRTFNRFHNRIYLFHYGGHSDQDTLHLKDKRGHADSLATLIGQQENLRLVFLNGCSNRNQIEELWKHGVRAVIATSAEVEDGRALALARQFYEALAGGKSIRQAFEVALSYVTNDHPGLDIGFRGELPPPSPTDIAPWGLYSQDEQVLDWKLQDAPKRLRWSSWLLAATLLIALTAGILQLTGILPQWFGPTTAQPFDIKVQVHGPAGTDDLILENQGDVLLEIPGEVREAPIRERGLATFEQLPSEYMDSLVRITIRHPQPYRATQPDSLYRLFPEALFRMEARLFNADRIFGYVYDFQTEQRLADVRVSIPGASTFTNDYGEFELTIPEASQAKFQRVSFVRENYQPVDYDSIAPHTRRQLIVPLRREFEENQ